MEQTKAAPAASPANRIIKIPVSENVKVIGVLYKNMRYTFKLSDACSEIQIELPEDSNNPLALVHIIEKEVPEQESEIE